MLGHVANKPEEAFLNRLVISGSRVDIETFGAVLPLKHLFEDRRRVRPLASAGLKLYPQNIVTVGHLLGGFEQACHRLWAATARGDETRAFFGLFEGLNWAVALDQRVGDHWAPEGTPLSWSWRERVQGAEVMRGVRWVRNSVHHQWSDAIYEREDGQFDLEDFDPRPDVFGSGQPDAASLRWAWRPAAELPPSERPDPEGEAVYREAMAGRSAALTLYRLEPVFSQVWQFMEGRFLFSNSTDAA